MSKTRNGRCGNWPKAEPYLRALVVGEGHGAGCHGFLTRPRTGQGLAASGSVGGRVQVLTARAQWEIQSLSWNRVWTPSQKAQQRAGVRQGLEGGRLIEGLGPSPSSPTASLVAGSQEYMFQEGETSLLHRKTIAAEGRPWDTNISVSAIKKPSLRPSISQWILIEHLNCCSWSTFSLLLNIKVPRITRHLKNISKIKEQVQSKENSNFQGTGKNTRTTVSSEIRAEIITSSNENKVIF